jgi:hypothetical protein
MDNKTRSLLEEINLLNAVHDIDHIVSNKADRVVASFAHLLELIDRTYSPVDSQDLTKRLYNAIKTQDPKKFQRGIKKINEERRAKRKE